MLGSTIPISILGTRYAMAVNPFWTPAQYSASYVFSNSTRSLIQVSSPDCRYALRCNDLWYHCLNKLHLEGINVSCSSCPTRTPVLSSMIVYPSKTSRSTDIEHGSSRENRDKVEVYLAFGASRFEACRPIAIDALRLALTPVINTMRYVSPPSSFQLSEVS